MNLQDIPPKIAEDVSLFLLGDSGVVFSESAQEIYHLNTTATFIWCQLEEGLAPTEAAAALAEAFSLSPREASRYVHEALADWQSHGILAGADPMDGSKLEPPALGVVTQSSGADLVALPDGAPVRHYRVLDSTYRVRFANKSLESWAHPLLQHLELSGPEAVGFKSVLVGQEPGGFAIALEGRVCWSCKHLEEVGHLVDMAIFSDALGKMNEPLSLHAGAVSQSGQALILPGKAGSGKTTLTAALMHAGLHFLSDDLILLDLDRRRVRGVPFCPSVKENGVDVLRDRFPGLECLPVHLRPDGLKVRYLPLEPEGRASEVDGPSQINWIVFPSYDPAGSSQLSAVAASKAIVELTRACTLMRRVRRADVEGLVSLVAAAKCFEMKVSALDVAVDRLIALWHDPL